MSTQSGDTQSSAVISSEEVSDDSLLLKCKKKTEVCKKPKKSSKDPRLNKTSCKKTVESTADSTTSRAESDDISTSYASTSEESSKKMAAQAKLSKIKKDVTSTSEEQSEESNDHACGDTGEASSPSSKVSSQTESSNVSVEIPREGCTSNTTSNDMPTDTEPPASSTSHVKPDASGWTLSEDMLLRSMKTGKECLPWAAIGSALKKNKAEVKARWKVIKDLPYNASSDDDDGNSKTQEESSPEAPREEGKKSTNKGQKQTANAITIMPAKAVKACDAESLSGEEASSEAHCLHRTEEKCLQDRYLQTHIWSELYPSSLQPVPDDHFSADDCAILAAADSKHKRSRWLEMQANFYNVTGRMVPLDVIRRKCEQAAERDVEKALARDGVVQRWIDSLSQED